MEFRKSNSVPAASGNTDSIVFTKTSTGKFDLYLMTQTGDRATLDRIAVNTTSAGTPPASPRFGDLWHDTVSDHLFMWENNGQGNYWIDIS
jgi:hypothetical protein